MPYLPASTQTEKTTVAVADEFFIRDSENSNNPRRISVTTLDTRWRQVLPTLSSASPTNVDSTAAAPGSSSDVARADHRHHFAGSSTGATSWVGLSDTPNTLTGMGGRVPVVNSGGTAIILSNPGVIDWNS